MSNRRIKPNFEQATASERRTEQARMHRRNQAIGLVVLAAGILVWWLMHTNPAWIFPRGWWRP